MTNISEINPKSYRKNLKGMALKSNLNPNAKEFVPSTMKWVDTIKDCNLVKEVNVFTMQKEKGELPDFKLRATSEVAGDCISDFKDPNAKEFVPSTMKWVDTIKDCNLVKEVNGVTMQKEKEMKEEELPDFKIRATSEVAGDCMPDFKEVPTSQHSAENWKDLLNEFNGKERELYMINVFVGYKTKNLVLKLVSRNKKHLPAYQKVLEETIQIDLNASSTLELKSDNLLAAKLFHGISNLINEKIVESADYSGGSEYSENEIAHQIEHIKMLETVFSQGRKKTLTDNSIVQCALGELCKDLGIPEKEIDETTDESFENLSIEDNHLVCYYDNEIHTSDNSFKSSEDNNGGKLFKYQSSDGCELHVNEMSDCEDKMECFETYMIEAPPTTPALSSTDVSIRVINDVMNMKPKVSKGGSTLSGAIQNTCRAVLGSQFKQNFSIETVSGCRCVTCLNRGICGSGSDIMESSSPEPHKINETKKVGSARQTKHNTNRSFNPKAATLAAESNLKKMTNRSGSFKEATVKNSNDKNTHNTSTKTTKTKRGSQKNGVRGSGTSSGGRQNESRKAHAIWKL